MKIFTVPNQSDTEYSNISSNQCSWVAHCFAKNYRKFKEYLMTNNNENFIELYKECLLEGSNDRKKYGKLTYGENIDNSLVIKNYGLNIYALYTKTFNDTEEFLKILPDDLRYEFYMNVQLKTDDIIKHIIGNVFALVSRHGQSFVVIPITSLRYLILDSHIHDVQLLEKEEMVKYVLCDYGGHTHITLVLGS